MDIAPSNTNYEVVLLSDGTFGVQITEPEQIPRTVGAFATRDEAESWIFEQTEPEEANEELPPVVTIKP